MKECGGERANDVPNFETRNYPSPLEWQREGRENRADGPRSCAPPRWLIHWMRGDGLTAFLGPCRFLFFFHRRPPVHFGIISALTDPHPPPFSR
ncbi:protein Wnt-4 [Lates japonicus]|uniref:Protein Wnt-4 n=1 Tax=Lates japonicus TaxID=270547 RepID=A0AAD3RLD3_LATJO|nr:protein Wnt-4 [Lates japonicus]